MEVDGSVLDQKCFISDFMNRRSSPASAKASAVAGGSTSKKPPPIPFGTAGAWIKGGKIQMGDINNISYRCMSNGTV